MLQSLLLLLLAVIFCSSFSQGSHAETDAEKLAKMHGSIIGAAGGCGENVDQDWLASSSEAIEAVSENTQDFRSAEKLRKEYAFTAYAQQKTQAQMNCADVRRYLGNFGDKLRE